MRIYVAIVGLLLLTSLLPTESRGTPETATWRRESLLGETANSYVVLRQEWSQPGSYYEFSNELRVVRLDKKNRTVMEERLVERSSCSEDPDTMVWHCSYDSLPSFDLSRFLTTLQARPAYGSDWSQAVSIDSAGLYVQRPGSKAYVLLMPAVRRQLPRLGEEPRVVGVETTDSHQVSGGPSILFILIQSNTASIDDDWSEDLLLVDEADLQRALER